MDRFVVSPELQMRLKRGTSKATINVPAIQLFNDSSFTLTSPGDQEGISLDLTLLFSAFDGSEFMVYASHVDGTDSRQLTFPG